MTGVPDKTGSCLCGAVRYRVSGPLRNVVACHCRQCRKTSGHHFAATSALRENVTIEGDVRWYHSSETAMRGFCPVCGSNLFWDGFGDALAISAGTLEAPTGLTLSGHIFCADKGDYYVIADDLPKADQRDPKMTSSKLP